jgi:hypothetical protein
MRETSQENEMQGIWPRWISCLKFCESGKSINSGELIDCPILNSGLEVAHKRERESIPISGITGWLVEKSCEEAIVLSRIKA